MKILVTGSSGTIGTRLCERLIEEGHDVVGADWEPNKWNQEIQSRTIGADLRTQAGWKDIPKDSDLIVHLAANARVYELVEDPTRAFDNMGSTFWALEFARTNKIPRFLFASSRECYGNVSQERFEESMVTLATCESPYTASKMAGEALVAAYRRCYNLPSVILRYSNVYGMYDDSIRVVPHFIRQAKKGAPLTVYGEDKCLDFTYIDDAVSGTILIIEKFNKVQGETFNVATGEAHTIHELAQLITKELGSSSKVEVASSRTGEVIRYTADITKAQELLGYKPTISFEEGVKKSLEWYKEHLPEAV